MLAGWRYGGTSSEPKMIVGNAVYRYLSNFQIYMCKITCDTCDGEKITQTHREKEKQSFC